MKVSNDPVALLCRKSIQFDGQIAVSEKETRNAVSAFVSSVSRQEGLPAHVLKTRYSVAHT